MKRRADEHDDLVTIEEAARRIGVRPIDVRHLLQGKELTAIQSDAGQWRIPAKALEEYIEKKASVQKEWLKMTGALDSKLPPKGGS